MGDNKVKCVRPTILEVECYKATHNTTSGIEPVYRHLFTRSEKIPEQTRIILKKNRYKDERGV